MSPQLLKNQGILLSFFLCFIISAPIAFSEDNEQAKKELSLLKNKIASLQKNLKSKRKHQSNALTQLKNSEKKIATTTKILRDTEKTLKQKNNQLKKLKQKKNNLESKIDHQKNALATQIRSTFINGEQEYTKLLLNQENPEALGRMLIYYDYIAKARIEKVLILKKMMITLNQLDKEIQKNIQILNTLKQSKQSESKYLIQLNSNRKRLIAKLSQEIKTKMNHLSELKTNAKELQQLIDSVRFAIKNIDFIQPLDGLHPQKGKLKWPTTGSTIQKYGSNLAQGLKSNGVIIKASEGKQVSSIHYGRVVYADWLRGFGLLLILDHGKGYMSLYGYNQSLYKKVGDWVESGESIAAVGKSGGKQQPSLYFELRHKGKPFNPQHWFQ